MSMFPIMIAVSYVRDLPPEERIKQLGHLVGVTGKPGYYYVRNEEEMPVNVYFRIKEKNVLVPEKLTLYILERSCDGLLVTGIGNGAEFHNPACGYKVLKVIRDVEIFRS